VSYRRNSGDVCVLFVFIHLVVNHYKSVVATPDRFGGSLLQGNFLRTLRAADGRCVRFNLERILSDWRS